MFHGNFYGGKKMKVEKIFVVLIPFEIVKVSDVTRTILC